MLFPLFVKCFYIIMKCNDKNNNEVANQFFRLYKNNFLDYHQVEINELSKVFLSSHVLYFY